MLRDFPMLLAVPALLAVFSPPISAAESPHELELKTERVIIFKDGYSLIIKRGVAVTDAAGEVYTDDVPDAAVLGSFWAVPEKGRLLSILAGWKATKDSSEQELPCTQPIEILLANKGKAAKVELHDKGLYTGVIHEVLVDRTETPVAAGFLEQFSLASRAGVPGLGAPATEASTRVRRLVSADPPGEHTMTTVNGSHFVLRTEEGDMLLPVSAVRSVVTKEMKTTLAKTVSTSKQTKRLNFRLEAKEQEQAVTLMYFRPGIRWIPTYRVSLSDNPDNKIANVSLQAELLNEAEDLNDVAVDIVVGVPNFRFRGTPSPMVLEATLRNALAEAAPDLMGLSNQAFSNAMFSQRSGEFRRDQADASTEPGVVALPDELTAGGAQDLFVYHLPQLTLGKKERIAVPIFTTDVPYRDVYTWDVHITRPDVDAAPSGSGLNSPLVLSKNEVWHQIQLTNNTQLPWTTGAVMIMQGNQPLAQELLTYTPPKDVVRVPVTISVDTRGSLSEQEVGRELRALKWDSYDYARIDKRMTIDLRNNKAIGIEAEITLRVGGKATQASHDGRVTLAAFNPADWVQYSGHPAVNNTSTVSWKAKLAPGETFKPEIVYHYFTRH